jgi:hypothetical protein
LQQSPHLRRRQVVTVLPSLLGLATAAAACGAAAAAAPPAARAAALDAVAAAASAAAPAPLSPDSLAFRIATADGRLQQPGYMAPWKPKQLYYPRWMFGEWEVSAAWQGRAGKRVGWEVGV